MASRDVAVTSTLTPLVQAYPWAAGFGTKYADPGTVPSGNSRGIHYAPSGNDIAVGSTITPFVSAYPWSAGFGTKYSDPGTIPTGSGNGINFSPSSNYVAIGHATTPFVSTYPWSAGFGTKFTNPGTLSTGTSFGINFSPSTADIAFGQQGTPYINAYPWSAGFGTKYSNPGTLPGGNGVGCAFSPSGNDIATNGGSNVTAYPWASGFGTKYTDPGTLPPTSGVGVDFSTSDIVVSSSATQFITAYPWNANFGTKYADPGTLPAGAPATNSGRNVSFGSSDVGIVHATTPRVTIYPWNTGFGTKYGDPGTVPAGNGSSISFNTLAGISFDGRGSSGDIAAASSYSGSALWFGSNRILVVDVSMLGPGVTVTAMTYGGATCTLIGVKSTVTSFGRVESWRICQNDSGAPAVGSNTLSVTLSGSLEFAVNWTSYTGVHQSSPTEGFNSAQATNAGSATDASVAITTVADNDWVHAAVVADDTSITANQVTRNNISGTLGSGANEDNGINKTPAGSVTMSYTNLGITTTWAIIGYAIRPVAAPFLVTASTLLMMGV